MGNIVYYLSLVLRFYETMMLIYIIMSWVPESRQTQLGRVLASFVEPYLSLFRKIIPPIGMIDFSPIVAFIVLDIAMQGLFRLF